MGPVLSERTALIFLEDKRRYYISCLRVAAFWEGTNRDKQRPATTTNGDLVHLLQAETSIQATNGDRAILHFLWVLDFFIL